LIKKFPEQVIFYSSDSGRYKDLKTKINKESIRDLISGKCLNTVK
jgi:hypothetical protein